MKAICVQDALLQSLKIGDAFRFRGLVSGDLDVDDAAGADVAWQEDRRELNLRIAAMLEMKGLSGHGTRLSMRPGPYQSVVLRQQHRDAGVDFAHGQRDQHFRRPSMSSIARSQSRGNQASLQRVD